MIKSNMFSPKMVHQMLKRQNYFLFECFLAAKLGATYVSNIAISMLIQDKMCLVKYGQDAHFCQHIQEMNDTEVIRNTRDDILGETTQLVGYMNLIECIPMVLWSLIVGSFLDNYSGGTVLMMFLNIIGELFTTVVYMLLVNFYDSSPYLLFIASLQSVICGGKVTFSTTAFRYISVNTNDADRGFKFVILEIIFIVGISLAMLSGGKLLVLTTEGPQIRTYYRNFAATLALNVIACVLLGSLYFIERSNKNTSNSSTQIDDTSKNQTNETQEENRHFLKILFDFSHILETLKCLFRRRENRVRLQIFLLYIVLFVTVITNSGVQIVALQFAQKVYEWDVSTITTFNSVGQVVSMTLLAVCSGILMKVLKLYEGTLILLSQLSKFSSDLLSGLLLKPLAAYLSLPIGCLGGVAIVSIRTKLSKLVTEEEVGKIFSLSSTIEALVPLASSLIYSNLFRATISSLPGAIYIFSSVIIFISMLIMIFERFYCPIQTRSEHAKKKKDANSEQESNVDV